MRLKRRNSATVHNKTYPVNRNDYFRLVLTKEQKCSLIGVKGNESPTGSRASIFIVCNFANREAKEGNQQDRHASVRSRHSGKVPL